MTDDQNKGFEVGESSSVIDYIKMKIKPITATTGQVHGRNNPDIASFVEANSTSIWAKKDEGMHMQYFHTKPEGNKLKNTL